MATDRWAGLTSDVQGLIAAPIPRVSAADLTSLSFLREYVAPNRSRFFLLNSMECTCCCVLHMSLPDRLSMAIHYCCRATPWFHQSQPKLSAVCCLLRPVIITDALEGWSAVGRWDLNYFRSCAVSETEVSETQNLLSQLLHMIP